jgi:hypothetical protein
LIPRLRHWRQSIPPLLHRRFRRWRRQPVHLQRSRQRGQIIRFMRLHISTGW